MSIDIDKMDRNASRLYRNRLHGILSTVSKVHDDYPFGSFVTYVSSRSRTAYLYLSDLAEHTETCIINRNLALPSSRQIIQVTSKIVKD